MNSNKLIQLLLLTACSGSAPPTIGNTKVTSDAGTSAAVDAGSTTATGSFDCSAHSVGDFFDGVSCGAAAATPFLCGGAANQAGFAYVCKNVGVIPARPPALNCYWESNTNDITRTVCNEAKCVPYEDSACLDNGQYKRARACPDIELGFNVEPPATIISGESRPCKQTSDWSIGDAHGQLWCCL